MNLCEAAEDYLGVVYGEGEERSFEPSSDADCEYDPVKHDNASFSAVINPNDANPVPPVPDELSGAESMGKISLGGWRGMNWRGWGVRGKGWLRN